MSDLINKAYKKFIGKHGMSLFSRDDETIAKRSFEAGYNAAPALSATPVVGGGGEEVPAAALLSDEAYAIYLRLALVASLNEEVVLSAADCAFLTDGIEHLSIPSPAPLVAAGAGQWVPAGERLPEIGWNNQLSHPVLVFGLGLTTCVRHYEPGAEAWYDAAHGVSEPRRRYSHWMPFPAAPQPEATPRHA